MMGKFALGYCVTIAAGWASYPFSVGVVRAQAAVAPIVSVDGLPSCKGPYRGALHAMADVCKTEGCLFFPITSHLQTVISFHTAVAGPFVLFLIVTQEYGHCGVGTD